MDLQSWLVRHGEAAQYIVYFSVLIGMSAWERARPERRTPTPRAARWRTNFTLTGVNILVLGALPMSFLAAADFAASRGLGLMNVVALPAWAVLPVGLLGRGFISWITHLSMHRVPLFWRVHRVPLFWRVHRVHHTDVELDLSTTVRFHPLEFPIGLSVGLPLIVTLGPPGAVLLAYEVLDVAVTVFSHADVSLPPWLERSLRHLLVTPALHRVHHSAEPEEADSNFSAVFPVWDLVFGTFRTTTRESLATMDLGVKEVRDARSWSIAWLLVVPFLRGLEDMKRGPSLAAPIVTGAHEP
jgi:sterol desaturase/sphingolipid hydroxylase (fatty acid hydroxylase superfamily)